MARDIAAGNPTIAKLRPMMDEQTATFISIVSARRLVREDDTPMRAHLLYQMEFALNLRTEIAHTIHDIKKNMGLPVGGESRESEVRNEAGLVAVEVGLHFEDGEECADFMMENAMRGRDPRYPVKVQSLIGDMGDIIRLARRIEERNPV